MTGNGVGPDRSALIASLIAIIPVFTFFIALQLASNLAQTSDSAQGFVVGHAVANGNVLLSGWHFPVDNFYFTDSVPYAVAEAVAGSRPCLMTIVPSLAYACSVLLALVLCVRDGNPPGEILQGFALVVLQLGVPVWIGVWNPLLMSDMHGATLAVVLAVFALLARVAMAKSSGAIEYFATALTFFLVVLTVASDPFSIVFGFGPATLVFAIETVRNRRLPRAWFTLALLTAATASGFLLTWIVAQIGGFTTENDLSFGLAPADRWWANLVDAVFGILTLWGTNPLNVRSAADGLIFAIRCAALVFVLLALVHVVRTGLRSGGAFVLDRLLCTGAAISLAACIPSAQFAKGVTAETMWHGGPPIRFLAPAALLLTIVGSRHVTGWFSSLFGSGLSHHFSRALTAAAAATLLTIAVQSLLASRVPRRIDKGPEIAVVRWLERHKLSRGAGEYWSANLLTAISGAAIGVRSMEPHNGRLVPYIWAEAQAFYAKSPQFAVWREPNQTGWTEALVRETWHVCAIRAIAGYHVALLPPSAKFATCSLPKRAFRFSSAL